MVNGGLRVHVANAVAGQIEDSEPHAHVRRTSLLPCGAVRPPEAHLRWHREHIWGA